MRKIRVYVQDLSGKRQHVRITFQIMMSPVEPDVAGVDDTIARAALAARAADTRLRCFTCGNIYRSAGPGKCCGNPTRQ
jgi:hypothetical protein